MMASSANACMRHLRFCATPVGRRFMSTSFKGVSTKATKMSESHRRALSMYGTDVEEKSLNALLGAADLEQPAEMKEDSTGIRKKFSGFFRRPPQERRELLNEIFPEVDMEPLSSSLSMEIADLMIENAIGGVSIPLGVAPNFVINGGKSDVRKKEKCAELIAAANQFCQSSVNRGGGVRDIYPRFILPRIDPSRNPYVVVHIDIDVCEAMGANIVNTVAEGVAPRIADLVGGRPALRILSNLCLKRRSAAAFRLPFDALKWKGVEGETVAERVIEAYHFAEDDPYEHGDKHKNTIACIYRAATHNKGVMNGIDSAAIAMGQDWRAIEASCHAAAAMGGSYGSMTKYTMEDGHLVGKLEMPMACGSKGGALTTHPLYKLTHKILGYPDAQKICQILVAVGLAQNFAAIRALAIEGIQKGHMNLHARNICLNAGVPNELVDECREYMTLKKKWDTATAEEFLSNHK
eukprot:jgi/Bigna1/126919/aug1.3_g1627